jgi:phage terminase large subunit
MSATVTPAVQRVSIPHALRLYKHQEETLAARHAGHRWRIANDHRQSGKDVLGLADLFSAAVEEPGAYLYCAPTRQMAENIAWHGVRASDGMPYLSVLPEALVIDKNEAELSLTIRTRHEGKHSRVVFASGNEPMRLRGPAWRGVVITEYAQFQDSTVMDTLRPALNRSGGWLLVLSTPLGVGNHFHELWQVAQAPDSGWWTATRSIHDTVDHEGHPLIGPEVIEAELRAGQRQDWLMQEYECKFVVGLIASIFGDVLTKCEEDHRILDLPQRMDLPTVVAFDLGLDDSTVAVFVQENGAWLDVIDVDAWQNLALPTIIQRVQAKGYTLRDWIAPHDIEVRDYSALGAAGQALTRWQVASKLGVRFTVAPKLSIAEGLDSTRRLFARLRFDTRRCTRLVEALSLYQRKWDPVGKVYAEKPLHNWASDYADALRTFAVGYRNPKREHVGRHPKYRANSQPVFGPVGFGSRVSLFGGQ